MVLRRIRLNGSRTYLTLNNHIPEFLRGQSIVGKSRTVVLCFEKATYHRPDLCPRQFVLAKEFECTLGEAKVDISGQISRSGPKGKDWSTHGSYKVLNEEWNNRHSLLIDFQGASSEANVLSPSNPQPLSGLAAEQTPMDDFQGASSEANSPSSSNPQPLSGLAAKQPPMDPHLYSNSGPGTNEEVAASSSYITPLQPFMGNYNLFSTSLRLPLLISAFRHC